jgi:hypothetical protein
MLNLLLKRGLIVILTLITLTFIPVLPATAESGDSTVILFTVPDEIRISLYTTGGELEQERIGFQLGETVDLWIHGSWLRAGDFPFIADDVTFIVTNEADEVIWTKSIGPDGKGWTIGPGGGWDTGVGWDQVDDSGNPVQTGLYKIGVILTNPTYSVPADYTGVIQITISDTTAPTAVITFSEDGPYQEGDTVTITASFSEAMADLPVAQIAISGADILKATNMTKVDGTHYTYVHTVGSGDGMALVALTTGTDMAGNPVISTPTSGAAFKVGNLASRVTMLWEDIYDSGDGGVIYGLTTDSKNDIITAFTRNYWARADWLTQKYTSGGVLSWTRVYDSGTWEAPYAGLTVDMQDNVFVGGNPDAVDLYDYHTVKYSPSGDYLWGEIYDSGEFDEASGIAADSQGNVLIIGEQSMEGEHDSTIVKYNGSGLFQWSKILPEYFMNGKIKVDSQGDIIVGGWAHYPDTGLKYHIAKLDSDGTIIWERNYTSEDRVYGPGIAMAIDSLDNVAVTGCQGTVKYNSSGNILWTSNYHGTDIAVDSEDNIYMINTSDITWLGPNGDLLWTEELGGYLSKITIDKNDDIIVGGTTSPLDPGGSHENDIIIRKYRRTKESQGSSLWIVSLVIFGGLGFLPVIDGIIIMKRRI